MPLHSGIVSGRGKYNQFKYGWDTYPVDASGMPVNDNGNYNNPPQQLLTYAGSRGSANDFYAASTDSYPRCQLFSSELYEISYLIFFLIKIIILCYSCMVSRPSLYIVALRSL
jgi:hypothetical protein